MSPAHAHTHTLCKFSHSYQLLMYMRWLITYIFLHHPNLEMSVILQNV